MSLTNYKQLLSELGRSTGIPDLAPDEDNYCCLGFDDKIIVHLQFSTDNETLMFFCQLGKVGEGKASMLYPRILKANLFWQGTRGSTIGVDDETKDILMAYQTPIGFMDYSKFQEILETFINTSELWISTLEAVNNAATPNLNPSPSPSPSSDIKNGIKA